MIILLCFLPVSFGCEQISKISSTKIKDIQDNPRKYENKQVTIYGTVTGAMSVVLFKYYEVRDDTGSIKVVTDRLLPTKGEKLKVTGRTTAIEIGAERWIVLREKSDVSGR